MSAMPEIAHPLFRSIGRGLRLAPICPGHAAIDQQSGTAQDHDEQQRKEHEGLAALSRALIVSSLAERGVAHGTKLREVALTLKVPPTTWATMGVSSVTCVLTVTTTSAPELAPFG